MREFITIDCKKAKGFGLNVQEAYLYSWFYSLPSWANKKIIEDEIFYFAARTKAILELPILTEKPDTMYRHYKSLEEKGLINYKKIDGKDYIALTSKSAQWNNSEYNQNDGFGKKSENNGDDSEKNPTYNKVSFYNKEKKTISPLEKKQEDISLLTSDTTMYESKKTNIELNCTLPINDVIIPVEQKKPKKEVKDPAVMLENRRFSKDFTDTWNAAGKEKLGQIGYVAINKLFAKHGYDKGMFFCHYLCQMQGSNEKSIAKIENQDKAFLFYQDPQEEQPKYLGVTKWDSYKRYKNELEEPSVGSFYNEDSFYAALEYYYSTTLSGTELVKKVRERVKEINCKYNKY